MKDDLGDRMKLAEAEFDIKIPSNKYIVLRADGRAFSKFTKQFDKPFDYRMQQSMIRAAEAMRKMVNAEVSYVQSDEITCVISPKNDKTGQGFVEHMFSGRIQKLTSLASSAATDEFNKVLSIFGKFEGEARFDCRIMAFDNIDEATNAVFWRVQDCMRNAISSAYRWEFGHAKMQFKSAKEMLEEMEEKSASWSEFSDICKYGHMVTMTKVGELQRSQPIAVDVRKVVETRSHAARKEAFFSL